MLFLGFEHGFGLAMAGQKKGLAVGQYAAVYTEITHYWDWSKRATAFVPNHRKIFFFSRNCDGIGILSCGPFHIDVLDELFVLLH